jgi:hypothetical protein
MVIGRILLACVAVLGMLCPDFPTNAQSLFPNLPLDTIDVGTVILIRANEPIDVSDSEGRVFAGYVGQDVLDSKKYIIIPRGSDVELVVRRTSDAELTLDLASIVINGQRFGTENTGSVAGTIVGAIGRGGSLPQTTGNTIHVVVDSLLTFRLKEPLKVGVEDEGYVRDGRHYHQAPQAAKAASNITRQKPTYNPGNRFRVLINDDKNVTWQGPDNAKVYVQIDDHRESFFASGPSGTLFVTWINPGHRYVFILKDARGKEIDRDVLDLRPASR